MTKQEQKIQNAKIRLAVRTGELPYSFTDKDEKNYRKIIYKLSLETGKKYRVAKTGEQWTISLAKKS